MVFSTAETFAVSRAGGGGPAQAYRQTEGGREDGQLHESEPHQQRGPFLQFELRDGHAAVPRTESSEHDERRDLGEDELTVGVGEELIEGGHADSGVDHAAEADDDDAPEGDPGEASNSQCTPTARRERIDHDGGETTEPQRRPRPGAG